MNFLATKFKTLLLLALLGGLTFQCEKKEDNQDTVTVAALAAIFSSAGDCTVNAPPRQSINTFTTAITANGTATITQTGTVPIVAHKNAALKLTAKNNTAVSFSGGSASILVYKSSSCPLSSPTTSGFTTTIASDNSGFTDSFLLSGSGSITFTTAGDYYIFIYAQPSKGQTANLSYTVTNL
ncbi:hypothetical protein ND816_05570 [Leptospira levettii]|uniref:LIC20153 family lipoprotein n=1 Tax=Leptospira levettii TaxID=2023178 RepID=UPI00223DD33C|nr:hypothetical protein [Leptospira levettii]MCW7507294.1 hypothetical protein [Leptospira levettii]MCW7518384.1 hypothetical protein [Leptospira levettii]